MSLDREVTTRIGKAAEVMANLNKRVWDNAHLTTKTKTSVYQACVLSTLLYGRQRTKQLNSFHMRCLRKILRIKWQDKITNVEVLNKCQMLSMHSILSERRLRWAGHLRRMGPERIPKALLYGELAEGERKQGRPCLRFKDVCKSDMALAHINIDTWE